ncbi:MAG: lipid A export permease/ATP-binding protein MsbA [Xanthomonadaceae bacterium]|nr:lipid A export permease/ATP-binding protein MsbA [Xanthomonadaceae bacterium]MDE1958981.1 lipid A export permease/ATP-binding protein MsbA [Xanthomonadaceae bacterium]MDE2178672.1 lipid A export permease/ATP-binding protein MsbA [Xanthomonadaceae bacterium]MDE2246316.1 lipid A export permease/ATP-binding protein MsbA [Xanthomonadaceae bacterium]
MNTSVNAPPPALWPTYKRLLVYVRPHWREFLTALFGMLSDAAVASIFTALIKPMIDRVFIAHDPVMTFWLPIIIVALFAYRGFASYIGGLGLARIGRVIVEVMRNQVFERYLGFPSSRFAREPSGHMLARLTYTSEQVAGAAADSLKTMILDGFMVLGMIIVMLRDSAPLTLVLFVEAPLVAVVVYKVGQRYRRMNRRIQDTIGSFSGVIDEAVGGFREVRIYGGRAYERKRFADINARIRALNVKVYATNALATSVVQTVAAMGLALVIFIATLPLMLHHITAGAFMSLITAMLLMLPSLKRLTTVQANLQRGVVAAQDLFAVIDAPAERDDGTVDLQQCRGDIRLEAVRMTYDGAEVPALNGVDLHCAAGRVTALVGRSGSGKTTVASLIPRFYEPLSGRLLLDGRPLGDYTLASLRRQIAWVGQTVVLFDDSIARNIAYGEMDGASESAILAAAEAANAMEFIRRLPDGIHSRIGEGGSLLSGGQRQRIAIARAILKNAPILILDEATSALDSESERLIQQALDRLMRDRTTLVIAHRLSTIEHADTIAVIEQGRVIEQGTHAALLARDGHYAALHRMQFREAAA